MKKYNLFIKNFINIYDSELYCYKIFFLFIYSLLITFILIFIIIEILKCCNYYKKKNNKTIYKIGGGISILISIIICIITVFHTNMIIIYKNYLYLLIVMFLVFFTGLLDDFIQLKPLIRLSIQLISSIILMHRYNIRINNFYGLFGYYKINYIFSVLITIFFFCLLLMLIIL